MRDTSSETKRSKLHRRGGKPGGSRWIIAAMMTTVLSASAYAGNGIGGDGAGLEPPPAYRLDSSDQVRLRVFEWRPALDRVFEWNALNDTYIVGPTGRVSLPLVGEVEARGATIAEFSSRVGEQMLHDLGLSNVPKISVEVVKYRPFYISGEVQQPGEYPYRPRLTVLQAFAIAGGISRDRTAGRHINRELIAGESDVGLYTAERNSLTAQLARLQAQIQGAPAPSFPEGLDRNDPEITAILRRETDLFDLQQQNLNDRLEILNTTRKHLETQIGMLDSQIANHQAERQLADEELDKVRSLVSRRLAVEPRRLEAQRNVYQLGAVGLRLEAERRQVRQEIAKVLSDIEELRGSHDVKVMQSLRETELRISELDRRVAASQHLLLDSARIGGAKSADAAMEMELTFEIVREGDGSLRQFAADEKTYVFPGDTIKVDIKAPPLYLSSAPGTFGKAMRSYTADAPQPVPALPKGEIRAGSRANAQSPNPDRDPGFRATRPNSDRRDEVRADNSQTNMAKETRAAPVAVEPPASAFSTVEVKTVADPDGIALTRDLHIGILFPIPPSSFGYFVPLPARSPVPRQSLVAVASHAASAIRSRQSRAIVELARHH